MQRRLFLFSLIIIFAIIFIGLQVVMPLNARGKRIELADSNFYFLALIITGLIIGLAGLIKPPRTFDVWLASFFGHVIYLATFWIIDEEMGNLWPLSLVFGALASFLPLAFAFLGSRIHKLFAPAS